MEFYKIITIRARINKKISWSKKKTTNVHISTSILRFKIKRLRDKPESLASKELAIIMAYRLVYGTDIKIYVNSERMLISLSDSAFFKHASSLYRNNYCRNRVTHDTDPEKNATYGKRSSTEKTL